MILTDIGEIGVHVGERVHILRPSLYAMTQLGTPAEIVEVYAVVMAELNEGPHRWHQFSEALRVIHACSTEDLCDVFGYFNGRDKYVRKLADMDDILPLARCLIQHGVTGVNKPLPRRADDPEEYVREFHAAEHVAVAVAHLGMTEREAWNATMTSLVAALRAKYPPMEKDTPGARAPTLEEHEATEAWFERVEAKRRKAAGTM